MTINEPNELSTTLLIGLGMFVIGVYLVYVMLGALIVTQDISYRLLDVLRALP